MTLIVLLSLRQVFIIVKNKMLLQKISQNEKQLNLQNSELQKLNEKILHDAQVDFLTQLSNRRYIDEAFERLIPPQDRSESLGLILVDVDYFKRINDTYGHQIGDAVLQGVAEKIRDSIRSNDIAGRYGGDEFIILLPGAGEEAVAAVAQRLMTLVHTDADLASWNVHLSIGVTSWCVTREEYEVSRLLKRADSALYNAKQCGRNQWKLWNESMKGEGDPNPTCEYRSPLDQNRSLHPNSSGTGAEITSGAVS